MFAPALNVDGLQVNDGGCVLDMESSSCISARLHCAGAGADAGAGAGAGKEFLALCASTVDPVCASAGEGGGAGGGKKVPGSAIIDEGESTSRRDCGLIWLLAGHDDICELASHDRVVRSGASRTSGLKPSIPSHLSKSTFLGVVLYCFACSMLDR